MGHIPYLADVPLSALRKSVNYPPHKVITEIRRSQNGLTIKSKKKDIHSLVTFKTTNQNSYFFIIWITLSFWNFPNSK